MSSQVSRVVLCNSKASVVSPHLSSSVDIKMDWNRSTQQWAVSILGTHVMHSNLGKVRLRFAGESAKMSFLSLSGFKS